MVTCRNIGKIEKNLERYGFTIRYYARNPSRLTDKNKEKLKKIFHTLEYISAQEDLPTGLRDISSDLILDVYLLNRDLYLLNKLYLTN